MVEVKIAICEPRPKPKRCENCLQPCHSIFCCQECAEERYAIVIEGVEASLKITREVLKP